MVSEYSLWWVLLFSFVSFLLIFWLYFFKKPYHKDIALPKIYFLAFLRGVSILLLLFLLLEPKVKYSSRKIEKPILVFAQDNSQSLRLNNDSLFYLNEYPRNIENFLEGLKSKFEIKKVGFGNRVNELTAFNYSETNTNFSDLFEFLKNNYGYSNNVQVILASDGLYNKGNNPRYEVQDLNFPIHTLQLGDTSQLKDVSVLSVKTNKLGFLNSKLPIRIGVKATNFASEQVHLNIFNGAKKMYTDEIQVKNNSFFIKKDIFISPDKSGLQKFVVELTTDKEEHSKINNRYEFVVDVLDNQRKISICFDKYHPDIAMLQDAINKNLNFTVDLINLRQKKPDLEGDNLVILYQVPSNINSYSGLLQQIKQKEIPILMLVGGNSNISSLNKLNLGVNLSGNDNLFSESSFIGNEAFNVFDLKESARKGLEKLPPLLSPLVNYEFNSEYQIIAYQGIKSIQTLKPQIAFTYRDKQKIAWVFGEGVWRWKLYLSRIGESQNLFNDLINKIVQYLALEVNRNQLVVKYPKSSNEGDEIVIDAEMYNESYELINKSDLHFILTNQLGQSFNYSFEKILGKYQLKISSLAKGSYSFLVKASKNDNNSEQKGHFIVSANNTEAKNLQADPINLSQISELSGGRGFTIQELSELRKEISENEYSSSTLSIESRYGNFVDLLFLLIIIIILMILEWFLKKYWLGI